MAIPGIHCTNGLLWILWVVCTSATVCGLFGCWGDIVTTDLSTCQFGLGLHREKTYKQYLEIYVL